ncbi:hypothetical protein RBC47_31720, partial [Pseudomonas fluorescens]|uniref:hypothetical protein n=1 Tax=Pseudomonas fluorescens TaxID=294 RepID=UPI00383439DE
AKTFWLLLGRLPKVTRCKSGTHSRRYRSNGYVPNPPKRLRATQSVAQIPMPIPKQTGAPINLTMTSFSPGFVDQRQPQSFKH